MNPHSTYANLSDEERAGLDARGTIATRAGMELLAFWTMHRYLAHSVKMDEPDALADDIAKVERQAVAAERVRLAEAFREWVAIVNYDRPRFTQDVADKFLALLEPKP